MEIKVLGTGCAKCRATVELIERVAREAGREVSVVKIEDLRAYIEEKIAF